MIKKWALNWVGVLGSRNRETIQSVGKGTAASGSLPFGYVILDNRCCCSITEFKFSMNISWQGFVQINWNKGNTKNKKLNLPKEMTTLSLPNVAPTHKHLAFQEARWLNAPAFSASRGLPYNHLPCLRNVALLVGSCWNASWHYINNSCNINVQNN